MRYHGTKMGVLMKQPVHIPYTSNHPASQQPFFCWKNEPLSEANAAETPSSLKAMGTLYP